MPGHFNMHKLQEGDALLHGCVFQLLVGKFFFNRVSKVHQRSGLDMSVVDSSVGIHYMANF